MTKAGVAAAGGGVTATGEIWRADSWLDGASTGATTGLHFPQILAAESGTYSLSIEELIDESEEPPALGFVAVEANSSTTGATAVAVTAAAPLALPATDKWTFNVWSFSPRMPSGWALLGECTSKWVPVSPQRFEDVEDDSVHGLSVRYCGRRRVTKRVCIERSVLGLSDREMPSANLQTAKGKTERDIERETERLWS